MMTLNTIEEFLSHIELEYTFKISNNLINDLIEFKQSLNFYIIPLKKDEKVSIIIDENLIVNKTFYKDIENKMFIHRDYEPAVINYFKNGNKNNSIWYQNSVIKNKCNNSIIRASYRYLDDELLKINYYYDHSNLNYCFIFIVYDCYHKKIDELLFRMKEKTIKINEFKENEQTKIIYEKILKMNEKSLFNIKCLDSDLELLNIQLY